MNKKYLVSSTGAQIYRNFDVCSGCLHRDDGPAIFYGDGRRDTWWWEGTHYKTFEEWCAVANITDERKMMLRLQYG